MTRARTVRFTTSPAASEWRMPWLSGWIRVCLPPPFRHLFTTALMLAPLLLTASCAASGPPGFTSPARAGFVAHKHGSFAITTVNTGGWITEKGRLPAGLVFRGGPPGQAAISGTPRPGSGGKYPVTLVAAGGQRPVSQQLAVIVDEAPRLVASSTSQWGVVFGHLNFRVRAIGYPVPRFLLAGKLAPGLVFSARHGVATISGSLRLSWLKTIEGVGAILLAVLTRGTSLMGQLGVAAKIGNAGYDTLYQNSNVTLVASNPFGTKSSILTMRILGPN